MKPRHPQDQFGPHGADVGEVWKTWWIDDIGRWQEDAAAPVIPSFTSPHVTNQGYNSTQFQWAGLIKVMESPMDLLIYWDVQCVKERAIDSLLDDLSVRKNVLRIGLVFFYGGWSCERYNHPSAAIKRIGQIQTYRLVEPMSAVVVRRQPLSDLRQSTAFIQKNFRAWDRSRGDLQRLSPGDLHALTTNSVFHQADARDQTLIFSHIGEKSLSGLVFGENWIREAIGAPYRKDPAHMGYSDRVCQDYLDVIDTGEPNLTHIRALIDLPDQDPIWVSYHRLLLRSYLPNGTPVLICLSERSQNLEVPFMGSTAGGA